MNFTVARVLVIMERVQVKNFSALFFFLFLIVNNLFNLSLLRSIQNKM